ncbi:TolB family protein [Kribbella monticola]|uniref:TolB family protein n=1 Tax=Kribbella monticola TaxID=2185285 RepID=UPI0013008197|nr:PD40 domain-containing protein [Kribbella monticola]
MLGAIVLGAGLPAQAVTDAVPSVPLAVKVIGTFTGVELRWQPPADADGLTGYLVHRTVNGTETTYPTWGSWTGDEIGWTQSERIAGAAYSVSATSADGEGPVSSPITPVPTTEAIGLTNTVPVEGGNYRTYAGQVAVQGGTQVVPLAADGPTHVIGSEIATSPDGKEIVFAKGQESLWRVRTDVPGATPVQLVSGSTGIYRMAWSPDGTRIVYERLQPDSSSCLDMVAATGGTPVRIGCHLLMPTWLPDSQTIIAKDQFQGLLQRVQARANGAVLSSIAGTEQSAFPTVSPDGRWIGYASGNAAAVIPVGGGTPKLGASEGQALASIAWSPDGTKLLVNRSFAFAGNVLQVLPVDAAGQPGAAANVFQRPSDEHLGTAVWQGPRVAIKPTATVNGPNLSIPFDTAGMATPLAVTCQLDSAPAMACISPYTKTGVPSGTHVFQVKAVEPGGRTTVAVRSLNVDAVAPTVAFTSGAFELTKAASVTLSYGATDSSGIGSYDVRYRSATYLTNFGGYVTAASATKATSITLNVAAGNEYCVSVRARDVFGTVSGWTAERCFSRPMDDRALIASAGWSRGANAVYYLGTVTSSRVSGASLTRTVQAKRLFLVATRCQTCGSLQVYYGGKSVGTVNLNNATTQYQAVIALPTPATFLSGTVQLTVRSPYMSHQIDGLAVRRT